MRGLRKTSFSGLLITLALAGGIACGAGENSTGSECGDTVVPEPTLTSIQVELFEPSCAFVGCHGGSSPAASLDLSSLDASIAGLIDVQAATTESDRLLVVPGLPEDSYLMNKLTNVGIESNSEWPDTEAMPAAGDAVCSDAIDVVADWIVDGCPI